jgi:hypothetical protein
MRRLIAAIAVAVLGAALPSLAHEGHVHKLMGTVTTVHADMSHVELKDAKGVVQSFYVDKATKITKGKDEMTLADLKPGTRVVVEGKKTGERLVATMVRVGGTDHADHGTTPHKH